jgi:hypothetical protein
MCVCVQGYMKEPSKRKLIVGRMPYVMSVNVREFYVWLIRSDYTVWKINESKIK